MNGSDVKEFVEIKEIIINSSSAIVITNNLTINCRMILDCSGYNSKFIKQGSNIKYEYFWNVYGKDFIYSENSNIREDTTFLGALVAEYKSDKILINDVPQNNSTYTPWMYVLSDKKIPLDEMKKYYEIALKSEFLKNKIVNCEIGKEKYGWIPAKDIISHANDRILSLGDSSALSPWTSGSTFSYMLKHLEEYCQKLQICIHTNSLTSKDLDKIVEKNINEKVDFDLGKLVFMLIKNCNSQEYDKLNEITRKINVDNLINFIFFLDAKPSEIMSIGNYIVSEFGLLNILRIFARHNSKDEYKMAVEVVEDLYYYKKDIGKYKTQKLSFTNDLS